METARRGTKSTLRIVELTGASSRGCKRARPDRFAALKLGLRAAEEPHAGVRITLDECCHQILGILWIRAGVVTHLSSKPSPNRAAPLHSIRSWLLLSSARVIARSARTRERGRFWGGFVPRSRISCTCGPEQAK